MRIQRPRPRARLVLAPEMQPALHHRLGKAEEQEEQEEESIATSRRCMTKLRTIPVR